MEFVQHYSDIIGLVMTYTIMILVIINVAVSQRRKFKRNANLRLLALEWTQKEYMEKHKQNKYAITGCVLVALMSIGVLYIPLSAYNPVGAIIDMIVS